MRFFILAIFISIIPLTAHAEPCPGFNSGMAALEAAVGGAGVKQKAYRSRSDRRGPPIAAINAAIDELEAVVHERNARATVSARQAPTQSYPRHKPAR